MTVTALFLILSHCLQSERRRVILKARQFPFSTTSTVAVAYREKR